MRAEERRRRDEIEERRVGDEQRRLQFERERGWAREISERNRLIAEEKRRREQQNIAEGLRRQAQANNKRRDAGPPKQVDCVSCMDPWDERDVAVLPCDHAYCEKCIKGMYCSFPYEIPAQWNISFLILFQLILNIEVGRCQTSLTLTQKHSKAHTNPRPPSNAAPPPFQPTSSNATYPNPSSQNTTSWSWSSPLQNQNTAPHAPATNSFPQRI